MKTEGGDEVADEPETSKQIATEQQQQQEEQQEEQQQQRQQPQQQNNHNKQYEGLKLFWGAFEVSARQVCVK